MEEEALVPSITREIDFYGDLLLVALVGETPYVAIRPITDFLGIDWSSQRQRIQRDEVLVEKARLVNMTGADQKQHEMFCLPIEFLPGWLFGIDTSRVKSELKEKLIHYRRECFHILWQAFQSESLTNSSTGSSTLEHIRATGLAIAQLAEQQIQMEKKLTKRLDNAVEVFMGFEHRLGTLEKKLSPAALITEEQAETISGAVKALAELMTTKDRSKNHYQGIFSELYRRFGVSSYKNIRLDRYEQVLGFLEDWHQSVKQN